MRKKEYRRRRQALKIFAVGAIGYGAIELLWRGRTHWTMLLTGGACLNGLTAIQRRMRRKPLCVRALTGASMITAVEYAVGWLVNRRMKMNVWDYSHLRGNVQGQICPQFFAAWYALCLPVFALMDRMKMDV